VFLASGFTFMVWGVSEIGALNTGPDLIGAACFFAIIARIAQAHLPHNGSINQLNTLPLKADTSPEIVSDEVTPALGRTCINCQQIIPSKDFNNSGVATCPHCDSLNKLPDNTFKVLIWVRLFSPWSFCSCGGL